MILLSMACHGKLSNLRRDGFRNGALLQLLEFSFLLSSVMTRQAIRIFLSLVFSNPIHARLSIIDIKRSAGRAASGQGCERGVHRGRELYCRRAQHRVSCLVDVVSCDLYIGIVERHYGSKSS